MCMLTYLPPSTQPSRVALYNGAAINDDGHGYAIVIPEQQRLLVRRSLDSALMIRRFMEDRAQYPTGPALFHSRWGTGGTISKFNCHPFRVGGDRQTVVAHNGIFPNYMQPRKGDRRCDTRLAADSLLEIHGHLSSKSARADLAEEIGPANKLVILTANPAYSSSAYIINEEQGIWDREDGCWYSNYDYEGWSAYEGWQSVGTYSKGASYSKYTTTKVNATDCEICLSVNTVDLASAICSFCLCCSDCHQYETDCMCWTPADSTSSDLDVTDEDRAAWIDSLSEDEYAILLAHIDDDPNATGEDYLASA